MTKKILIIATDLWPIIGGIGEQVNYLGAEFQEKGYTVEVLTNQLSETTKTEVIQGMSVFRYTNKRELITFLIKNRKNYIGILSFQFWAHSCILGILKFFRVVQARTLISTTSGGDTDEIVKLKSLYKFGIYKIYFFFLAQNDVLNCYNSDNKKHLEKTYWNKNIAKKAVKIYRCLPMPKSLPPKKTDIKNILFISRLEKEKGILETIDAFKNIPGDSLRLTIVGYGEDVLIQSIVKKSDSDSRIRFVGKKYGQEKEAIFKKTDLLVFPTYYPDGFGIVLLEAVRHSIPIITTDYADVVDIFGENILITKKADSKDLENKMRWMIENISDFSYDYSSIAKDFDSSVIANKILKSLDI